MKQIPFHILTGVFTRALVWALACSITLSAMADTPEQTGTPEQADTPELLQKLAAAARGTVYNICLIENGVSYTAEITPAQRCHNGYSVAKLYTSAAIGILEDRGLLSTDEKIYPLFAEEFPDGFDPKWKDVTIEHVLTHRIGFEHGFLDIDAEECTTWESDDFLSLVFSRPLEHAPGTHEAYSDAAFYLASRIVTKKCGRLLEDFLRDELLRPMGFAEYAFSRCPLGYTIGATGMYFSTEDTAKLGELFLNKGVYHGKRYLSEEYVNKSLERLYVVRRFGEEGYRFTKSGMNGQLLYFNYKTRRVVMIHSFRGNISELEEVLRRYDK